MIVMILITSVSKVKYAFENLLNTGKLAASRLPTVFCFLKYRTALKKMYQNCKTTYIVFAYINFSAAHAQAVLS